MSQDEGEGKRHHPREAIELKVEYKRLNTFFSDYTRNISKGGTFIKTDKPLECGTDFVFKLYVPQESDPIRIHGVVQWVVRAEDVGLPDVRSDVPGMGIRFVYDDEEARSAVERRVEALMVDSLGKRLYTRLMEHSRAQQADGDA